MREPGGRRGRRDAGVGGGRDAARRRSRVRGAAPAARGPARGAAGREGFDPAALAPPKTERALATSDRAGRGFLPRGGEARDGRHRGGGAATAGRLPGGRGGPSAARSERPLPRRDSIAGAVGGGGHCPRAAEPMLGKRGGSRPPSRQRGGVAAGDGSRYRHLRVRGCGASTLLAAEPPMDESQRGPTGGRRRGRPRPSLGRRRTAASSSGREVGGRRLPGQAGGRGARPGRARLAQEGRVGDDGDLGRGRPAAGTEERQSPGARAERPRGPGGRGERWSERRAGARGRLRRAGPAGEGLARSGRPARPARPRGPCPLPRRRGEGRPPRPPRPRARRPPRPAPRRAAAPSAPSPRAGAAAIAPAATVRPGAARASSGCGRRWRPREAAARASVRVAPPSRLAGLGRDTTAKVAATGTGVRGRPAPGGASKTGERGGRQTSEGRPVRA